MPESLVVGGSGYVGRVLVAQLRDRGRRVTVTSRRPGAADLVVAGAGDLDRALAGASYDQVVVLPQLNAAGGEWLTARVDGPRWLVFSSAQLGWATPAPGDDVARRREGEALERGATVFRPTMIFGRGGDLNVTRLVRFLRRWRVPVLVGDGRQLVQPVHVDDLCALVAAHAERPAGGRFEVGGEERVSTGDLLEQLCRLVGIRRRPVALPGSAWRLLAAAPLPGLRADQIRRLLDDKVVDISAAREELGWSPRPLAERLAQAVQEALGPQPPAMAAR